MLPQILLDDRKWQEIVDEAMRTVPRLTTEWTDFNAHDPGVTLVELLAWRTEMLDYRLDRVGRVHREKYLKLAGQTLLPAMPARTRVRFDSEAFGRKLPAGTKLLAGRIPFETVASVSAGPVRIVEAASVLPDGTQSSASRISDQAGMMRLFPFGSAPTPGCSFVLGFEPAPEGADLRVHFDVAATGTARRLPIGDFPFIPLARIRWEWETPAGWQEMEAVSDETHGFLFSGFVTLRIADAPGPARLRVRALLLECGYEAPPVIGSIGMNMVSAEQRDTIVECHDVRIPADGRFECQLSTHLALHGDLRAFLDTGDGWRETGAVRATKDFALGTAHFSMELSIPAELPPEHAADRAEGGRIRLVFRDPLQPAACMPDDADGFPEGIARLDVAGAMPGSIRLMAEEPGQPGLFRDWRQVGDFDACGPEDACYSVDAAQGVIRFGDGDRGMAPEGRLIVCGCTVTLGARGNLKEGLIDTLTEDCPGIRVMQRIDATGGEDAEDLPRAFLRLRRMLAGVERVVTDSDAEQLAARTPGLRIGQCRAIPGARIRRADGSFDPTCVTLVVQPATETGKAVPSPAFLENVRRHLAGRMLIGSHVNVIGPEPVGILLYADISVRPWFRDAESVIANALDAWFRAASREFGRPVRAGAVYGIIDSLDCVESIRGLSLQAVGKGISCNANGDVLLPPNGAAWLKERHLVLSEADG